MEGFRWSIVVAHSDLARVRRAQHDLAGQVLATLPETVSVLVTTHGGVSLLDVAGEPLDLTRIPMILLETVIELYGLGVHDLQRPLIREAYRSRTSAPR